MAGIHPDTIDGLFHAGNPLTGEKGTVLTTEWLNTVIGMLASGGLYGSPPQKVDASTAPGGVLVVPILAANDSNAVPMIFYKTKADTTGNAGRLTPAAGTIDGAAYYDLTGGGEMVEIIPIAAENDWYVKR